eukprot:g5534.t1
MATLLSDSSTKASSNDNGGGPLNSAHLVQTVLNPMQQGISLLKAASISIDATRMQQELEEAAINLPKIVVCGFQSVGKSTTLEMIAGVGQLLPKDDAICTTCPCILSLMHDVDAVDPYARFPPHGESGRPEIRFEKDEFSEKVWREIALRQPQKVGGQIRVSRTPVEVEIHWRQYDVDLVLVDLPGLRSSETQSVEANARDKILEMYKDHLSNENTIIMVIEKVETMGTNPGGCVGAGMAVKFDQNWNWYKKFKKNPQDIVLPDDYDPNDFKSRVVCVMSNFKSPCMDQGQYGGPARPHAFENIIKLLRGDGEVPCRNGWYALRWLPKWNEMREKGEEVTLQFQYDSELAWFKHGADPDLPYSQYNPKTMWEQVYLKHIEHSTVQNEITNFELENLESERSDFSDISRTIEQKEALLDREDPLHLGLTLGAKALTGRLGKMLDNFIRKNLPNYPKKLQCWINWAENTEKSWLKLQNDVELELQVGTAIREYASVVKAFLSDGACDARQDALNREVLDTIVSEVRVAKRMDLEYRLDEIELFAGRDGKAWGSLKLLLEIQNFSGVLDWKVQDPKCHRFIAQMIQETAPQMESVVRKQLDEVSKSMEKLFNNISPAEMDLFSQLRSFVRKQAKLLINMKIREAMQFVAESICDLMKEMSAGLEKSGEVKLNVNSAPEGGAKKVDFEGKKEEIAIESSSWPDAVIEGHAHVISESGVPQQYWIVLCEKDAKLRFFDSKESSQISFYERKSRKLKRMFRLRNSKIEKKDASTIRMWRPEFPDRTTIIEFPNESITNEWFQKLVLVERGFVKANLEENVKYKSGESQNGQKLIIESESEALARQIYEDFSRARKDFTDTKLIFESSLEKVKKIFGGNSKKVAQLSARLADDGHALDKEELPLCRELGQMFREAKRAETIWKQIELFQKDPHGNELIERLAYIKSTGRTHFAALKKKLAVLAPENAVLGIVLHPFMHLKEEVSSEEHSHSFERFSHKRLNDAVAASLRNFGVDNSGNQTAAKAAAIRSMLCFGETSTKKEQGIPKARIEEVCRQVAGARQQIYRALTAVEEEIDVNDGLFRKDLIRNELSRNK